MNLNITQRAFHEKIDRAGAALRAEHGLKQMTAEAVQSVAERFGLPIGSDISTDPIANAIHVSGYTPEARDQLKKHHKAAWVKYKTLADSVH